jgi:hypothetical protein
VDKCHSGVTRLSNLCKVSDTPSCGEFCVSRDGRGEFQSFGIQQTQMIDVLAALISKFVDRWAEFVESAVTPPAAQ